VLCVSVRSRECAEGDRGITRRTGSNKVDCRWSHWSNESLCRRETESATQPQAEAEEGDVEFVSVAMKGILMNQNSVMYGSNGAATPVTRELKMPLALDLLENNIGRLGKVAEEFSLRLEKVCTPQPPSPEVMSQPKDVPQSEYVDNLFRKAEQVSRICQNLENILARLDL
jgi:hypothetical protein